MFKQMLSVVVAGEPVVDAAAAGLLDVVGLGNGRYLPEPIDGSRSQQRRFDEPAVDGLSDDANLPTPDRQCKGPHLHHGHPAQPARGVQLRLLSVRRLSSAACAALGVALLAACSTGGDDHPEQAAGAEGSSPTSMGERTPMSVEEFDYEDYLEILQRASGVENPPETQIMRVVAPEEQPGVWQACMTEAGYAVSVTFDGGLTPPQDLPDDQWDGYDLADYTCHAQYPVDQTMYRTFGEEQIEATYAYYVDVLTPCLEERGFTVSEPATWEAFRSSWTSDGQGGFHASDASWFPYDSVDAGAISVEELESLNQACPQAPPAELLYSDG